MCPGAALIADRTRGRFLLGLGVSHQPVNDALGIEMTDPIGDLRRYVAEVRSWLRGQGPATHLPQRPAAHDVPIYVAALTSRTVEQAAEVADGIMPNFWSPERVERSKTWIARGRAKHPELAALDVTLGLPTFLGDDLAALHDLARQNLALYTYFPFFQRLFRASGFPREAAAMEQGAGPAALTDELLDSFCLIGPPPAARTASPPTAPPVSGCPSGKLVARNWLPARLVKDLGGFEWDSATVKVDWALSGPVPWTAHEAAGAGTVHLGCDEDGLAAFGAELARGRVRRRPFLLLGQMTTADPTRSPSGTEAVWAYTHVPRGSVATPSALARRAAVIEDSIERQAPGFRDRILERYVQGPAELADHDPSLVGGAINGGTTAIHQQLFFRPVPGLGRADTPVDRLYLAGASAHPGGAVHGGPGANAARAALARNGIFGGGYAALIKAANRAVYG